MTRSVTLHLDEFSQEALDGYARQQEDSAGSVLRTAAAYYHADRGTGRTAWRIPRFRRQSGASGEAVRIAVDDETWRELEDEAGRQGVAVELLAEHAILYFLADLESGQLAERLSEE